MTRPDRISATLIGILVALLIAAFSFGMSTERPHPPGPGPVFMGLFLIALGIMFAASYFYSSKASFLAWLLSFAESFPGPHSRKTTFMLPFVAILSGAGARRLRVRPHPGEVSALTAA